MTPEGITDKIRAILRKADADNNASEAEREVAMRMANRLLLKHGLSMQDIGSTETDDRTFEKTAEFTTEGDLESWRGSLLFRIAHVYFCEVYYTGARRGEQHWYIVGRKSNADAARAMFEFVAPQLEGEFAVAASRLGQYPQMARRYAVNAARTRGMNPDDLDVDELARIGKTRFEEIRDMHGAEAALSDIMFECGTDSPNYAKNIRSRIRKEVIAPHEVRHLAVWRRSFFDSAINRITARLRELMTEEVTDLGDAGTALVKNEAADLSAFMKSIGLNLGKARSARQFDYAGGAAGQAAGDRADISGHRKVATARRELTR